MTALFLLFLLVLIARCESYNIVGRSTCGGSSVSLRRSGLQKYRRTLAPVTTSAVATSLQMAKKDVVEEEDGEEKKPSVFDQVASKGLAGVLAIATAEAIFWALGVPLAQLYYRYTTGEWIDMMTSDGQLQAAGFSFGYGGFATVILQYRVTLFAIPLVPIMEKLIVEPGKKFFGDGFGAVKPEEE